MDFTFTQDQWLFRDSVREFLVNEVTPERIRATWASETGRSDSLWQQMAELGLTALTVPEAFGGLGMSELDFILLAQECGYVALPEPLVNTALVAVPLLCDISALCELSANDAGAELAQHWLPKVADGKAKLIAAVEQNLVVEDAHIADLLLLERAGALYALTREQFTAIANESVDPSRRLFTIELADGVEPLLSAVQASPLLADSLNRGALACAAQALGLTQRMIDLSVAYTSDRQQFGVAIGSFQAVKHHMANVAVRLEYAKAPVHRAAYAVTQRLDNRHLAVSHAKLVATEAAALAAKNSIQVHGAMGYTWEVDLHIFMKKAWALTNTWGDVGYHKQRVADVIFAEGAAIGPEATFG